MNSVSVLLVEDNPADVRLTREALAEAKLLTELFVAADGEQAMAYLNADPPHENRRLPDLVILDLNLPRKDGREVLKEMKEHEELRVIPVVILTSSKAEEDIARSYKLHANCYITKPVDLQEFFKVVRSIDDFWFTIVRLPTGGGGAGR